jgi:hypothetical protein
MRQEWVIDDAKFVSVATNASNTVRAGHVVGTLSPDAPEIIGGYSLDRLTVACALAEQIGTEKVVLVRFGDEQPEKTLLILMDAFGDRFTSVAPIDLSSAYAPEVE